MRLFLTASAAVLALAAASSASAEEGMWTYDNFPIQRANAALGTDIDQAWLDHARLSSVRLTTGCSAGIVSGEGLVMTNNHCVSSCVQNISTPEVQYAETGFTPATREEERRCPGMQAEVLIDISDVTERMQAAGAGLDGSAFTRARDAESAAIETEACEGQGDLRCQVVSLYRGGQFKLYTFRKYPDVRLAFAPEERASSFGGDLDNFSFPRFALDAAFLRLYESDRPVATETHFTWNADAPTPGEAVFVSGTPGATQRLLTQDQLATVRDVVLPLDQLIGSELRGRLIRFSEESDENRFIASSALSGVENTYKRGMGRMRALIDGEFMGRRQAAEEEFRARVVADPALAAQAGDPWSTLAEIQPVQARLYPAYSLLEGRAGGGSRLFGFAQTLVRAAQERGKPSGERLPEFADSRLPLVQQRLFADLPVYPALDEVQLSWWLSKTREILTVDDPRVRALLGDESPEGMAERLSSDSTLGDPAVRRALWEGGLAAIEASDDPMIRFALAMQPINRPVREQWEAEVEAPTVRASEALAAARFAVYGDDVYPDATGTLRLSFGKVEGWTYEGRTVEPLTTFAGLFDRATGADPFVITPRIAAARERIDMDAVMNMSVSTDTIGGSSGSPAINARGEIIGANFDSTVLTQRNAYGYDINVNRSVIVTTQAVTEALRNIYGMDRLLTELGVE
ncbi:MAG: S46 family peptidase [Brevundimonas sp.]|uniref:S46 family peptidase n=1 Tax=Brevundimonas sp. TaxID=1871086 RepID=UPI00391BE9F3